jgi:hypothetical protein
VEAAGQRDQQGDEQRPGQRAGLVTSELVPAAQAVGRAGGAGGLALADPP